MDIFKLAKEILSDKKRAVVLDLLIEEIAEEINPMGWSLIKTSELDRLRNTKVEKPQRKKVEGRSRALVIHGRHFPSIAKAADFYEVSHSKLYSLVYKGVDLETVLPKKEEDLKLTAQAVDENGIVTKIRRNGDA